MIVDLQVDVADAEGALLDPAALVQGAKAAGLDGMLLTKDDDRAFDTAPYQAAAAEAGLALFSGLKMATNHGLILCIFPEDAPALEDGWAPVVEDGLYDAHAIIDAVEEHGGVTVALRPYDRDVAHPMGDHLFSLQGLSACEVHNGSLTDIANDLALEAASNMEMPRVGSAGAKAGQGLGTAATLFRNPAGSTKELCDAIRAGDCWPVTFSDNVPKAEASDERRGGRGGRDGGGGGRDRGRGRGGRDRDRDRGEREPRGGRGGRGRGGGTGGGGGGGQRSGGGGGGGVGREGGGGREGGRERDGNRMGDRTTMDRGDKRRRGRRGRGGGGARPDDIGNRAPGAPRVMDEDAGNRIRSEHERKVAEDLGNRLRPGEASPYRPAPVEVPVFHDDEDDNFGNR